MMGDVVDLMPDYLDDHELIADLCRFAEGLLTEKQVRKRHHLAEKAWRQMGKNDELVEKIEAERIRRIRDGSSKRELAQKHIVRGPEVLGNSMDDPAASPRHRVDAIKVLDGLAQNGPQGAPASDRFIITINLTADGSNSDADVIHFNKSIAIDANDVDPNDTTPQKLIPISSVKKDDDG